MTNELNNEERCVITATLAQRIGQCDDHIDSLTERSLPDTVGQADMLAYWVKQRTEAQRTLVRARQVFWS